MDYYKVATVTGDVGLNERIARTKSIKGHLLLVLREIGRRNNPAELGPRRCENRW